VGQQHEGELDVFTVAIPIRHGVTCFDNFYSRGDVVVWNAK
jgi:hypothetical protein